MTNEGTKGRGTEGTTAGDRGEKKRKRKKEKTNLDRQITEAEINIRYIQRFDLAEMYTTSENRRKMIRKTVK